MSVRSFEVHVPEATLRDLDERLTGTRWAPDAGATDWEAGTSPVYLRSLVDHWRSGYDWRRREAAMNRFHHYLADVGGATVHFIHERGKGDSPLPIILTHAYPDSFLRFQKLIPLLTDPVAHGAARGDAFDLVVPSLPGFGFSDPLPGKAATFRVGDRWHELMSDVLGYPRYGAHGGDWGSTVTEHLARGHARSVVGIHPTDVPFWHAFQMPQHLSEAERALVERNAAFQLNEGAYAMIQGTRPQTLARRAQRLWILERAKDLLAHSTVPAGFAIFPNDLGPPQRE